MANTAVKMDKRAAAIVTDYSDPIADELGLLHIIMPRTAVHIVTIRWHAPKGQWVVGPGTFHALPGDLIYFTNGTLKKAMVMDLEPVIGASLSIDPSKTALAPVLEGAVVGDYTYRVTVNEEPAVGDDGTDPSIIID